MNIDEQPGREFHSVLDELRRISGRRIESYLDPGREFISRFDTSTVPYYVLINQNREIVCIEENERQDWQSPDARALIRRAA